MFKTTKAKVIFVVVFCIICISITIGLILYKNIEIEDEKTENRDLISEDGTKVKDVAGIDLKGTYNQNDLTISEKKVTKEKVEIRYCQIYGLKDKIIQDNINKELEQVALNCYKEKIKNLDEVINVYVSMSESANFANTLSFNIDYTAKIDDNADGFYQGYKHLNYDLTTGEKIAFDKLFTSDAPIENILRKSAYYSLIQYNLEDSLSAGAFIVSDYGDIEGEIIKLIDMYNRGKITEFSFGTSYIRICYNEDKYIYIYMKDYAEYIAIYSRYLTSESIYEANNIGLKDLYTLSNRYKDDQYRYVNYQKGRNYFIDIIIDNWDEEESSKNIKQSKIKDIEDEIQNVKAYANRYPEKFYVLNYYININTLDMYTTEDHLNKEKLTRCIETGNSYEMTIHDFEESVEPIIIEYNRRELSGEIPNYLYDFKDVLKVEPQATIEYYNPTTGEKVVI